MPPGQDGKRLSDKGLLQLRPYSPSPLVLPGQIYLFFFSFYHQTSFLPSLVFIYVKRFWPLTSLDSRSLHMPWFLFVCLVSEFLLFLDLNLYLCPIPNYLKIAMMVKWLSSALGWVQILFLANWHTLGKLLYSGQVTLFFFMLCFS